MGAKPRCVYAVLVVCIDLEEVVNSIVERCKLSVRFNAEWQFRLYRTQQTELQTRLELFILIVQSGKEVDPKRVVLECPPAPHASAFVTKY